MTMTAERNLRGRTAARAGRGSVRTPLVVSPFVATVSGAAVVAAAFWSATLWAAAFLATVHAAEDEVTIEVTGEVGARCVLGEHEEAIDLGRLGEAASKEIALEVDCNAPFALAVTSAHGGLVHQGGVAFVGSFTESLPYTLELELALEDPEGLLALACASAEMTEPTTCAGQSEDSIAIARTAALTLAWNPAPHVFLAGLYTDELTVTVSVLP